MKKIVLVGLSIIMLIFVLTGCGKKEETKNYEKENAVEGIENKIASSSYTVTNKKFTVSLEGQNEEIDTVLYDGVENNGIRYKIQVPSGFVLRKDGNTDRYVQEKTNSEEKVKLPEIYMQVNVIDADKVQDEKNKIAEEYKKSQKILENNNGKSSNQNKININGYEAEIYAILDGTNWNSIVKDVYVIKINENKTMIIKSVYYMEAAEGFGHTFNQLLLNTLEIKNNANESVDKNTITETNNNENTKKQNTNSSSDNKKTNAVNNTSSNTDYVNGKYQYKVQSSNVVHESYITISNQNESSIDFSISTVHGKDVDHVNTGELSGKATRIDVPEDGKVPDSNQYAYQYVDTVDGKTNKITFVYTAHRMFEYVTVTENYASDTNPYAGHNVYFSGEYEKIQN